MTNVTEQFKQFNPEAIEIGDLILDSPIGPGTITGITEAGYPQVDLVAVSWCRRVDGAQFDPYLKKGGSKRGTPGYKYYLKPARVYMFPTPASATTTQAGA